MYACFWARSLMTLPVLSTSGSNLKRHIRRVYPEGRHLIFMTATVCLTVGWELPVQYIAGHAQLLCWFPVMRSRGS